MNWSSQLYNLLLSPWNLLAAALTGIPDCWRCTNSPELAATEGETFPRSFPPLPPTLEWALYYLQNRFLSQQELLDNKMGPWLGHPMLSELNICLEQDLIFLKISWLTVWPLLLPRKIKVSMQSQKTALDHLGCCDMVYKQGRGWEQSPGCPESTGLQWNQLKVINILPDFAGSFSASEMRSLLSQGTDSPCAQTSPPRAGSPSCQAASVCVTFTSEQNDWKAAIILLLLQ